MRHARLEGFLADVRLVPVWLGFALAGAELDDMLVRGTREERGWAEHALRWGSRELVACADALGRKPSRSGPNEPAANPLPASAPVATRFEIRWVRQPTLMRELGVEVVSLGISAASTMEREPYARSAFHFLDDAQLEVFQLACARMNEMEPGERSLDLEAGERQVVDLGHGSRLTLGEVVLSASRKFLTLEVALRERTPQGLVFAPRRTLTVRNAGTFALQPRDRLEPDSEAVSDLYVAITVKATRPAADGRVPLAPSESERDPR